MTTIEALNKEISIVAHIPDLIQSCKLFSPGVVDPVDPGDPGSPPNPDTWIPLPPDVNPDDLPPAPTVVDTSPNRMIGCIVSTGTNAQSRLNALFPEATAEDGVIERTTNDIWVLRESSWVNVGPNPGPTIVISRPLKPWNETVKALGLTRTLSSVRSLPYSLELFADIFLQTKTKVSAKSLRIVEVDQLTVSQQALAPRRVGEEERIVAPTLSAIVYSQSNVSNETTPANATNMQNLTILGTAASVNFISGQTSWVKMELGDIYDIDRLVIGTAAVGIPVIGATKERTENLNIQWSNDDLTWTTIGTTGTFLSEGIYQFEVTFAARYIRLARDDGSLAVTEFYPLAPKQENPIYFGPRIYVPTSIVEVAVEDPILLIGGIYQENVLFVDLTAQPPSILTGIDGSISVEVPVSTVDLSTGIPTITIRERQAYWGNYYSQTLGWQSIFMPDGWVN